MNATPQSNELFLTIISPHEKLFEGTCSAVTSINRVGEFDILPRHENFISLITKYVRVKVGTESKEFPITEAIMKAEQNTVFVFIEAEKIS